MKKMNLKRTLLAAALSATLILGTATTAFADEWLEVDDLEVTKKTQTTVILDWDKDRDADGYQIYQYSSADGKWKRIFTTGKSYYKVTGLKSGYNYKFRVRAYVNDADGGRTYGDYEYIKVKTVSKYANANYIGTAKAKSIALDRAGLSSATFTKVKLDTDDGVKVYEVEFYKGNYEYEVEINAKTGKVRDYDRDSRWDD